MSRLRTTLIRRFHRDGKRIAISVRSMNGQQLAVYERDRGVLMRIVANGATNNASVWTPDGKDLLFDAAGPSQKRGIYRIAADGSSAPQLVRETSISSHVTAIGGAYAAVAVNDPVTSADLWLLSLSPQYDMRPFKQNHGRRATRHSFTRRPLDGLRLQRIWPLRDLCGAGAWPGGPLANLHRRRRATALGTKRS